jgi:hypothetical protein
MKTNTIIRNLLIAAIFALTIYATALACAIGVSGLSNPNSIVCAKDANGKLWCTQTDATGHFYLIGGGIAPSTDTSCLPAGGQFTFYNIDCPQNGLPVDRSGSSQFGGSWLDVSCVSCVPAPSDMVAWYTFDETTGNKTSERIHSEPSLINPMHYVSVIDGTYFGSPTHLVGNSYGWVSNAIYFDGINDYMEAPNHASLNFGTGDLTIDAWVKIDHPNDTTGVRVLVEKREQLSSSNYRGYSFYLYNGKLAVQLAAGYPYNYGSNLVVPADGLWHLVAVTVNRNSPNSGTFYLSQGTTGNFTVQTATFNALNSQGDMNNNRPLRIGSITLAGPNSFFKGNIDEVELFNRVLSGTEIQSLVQAGRYGKCKPAPMIQ